MFYFNKKKNHGHDNTVVGFTTKCAISAYHHIVVSSNPVHGEVYSIQHHVIKIISNLRQVGGFLWFPHLIKLTATIKLKYCVAKHHKTKPFPRVIVSNLRLYGLATPGIWVLSRCVISQSQSKNFH